LITLGLPIAAIQRVSDFYLKLFWLQEIPSVF